MSAAADTARLSKIAAYLVRLGCALVPIPRGSKAPVGNGWQQPENLITDEGHARQHFSRSLNIGVHLGRSGLLSVDIDDLDTATLAFGRYGLDLDAIIQAHPVKIQGRGVRLWYRLPEGLSLTRRALRMVNLEGQAVSSFELRAGDVQDVAPGSLHPAGMEYRFIGQPPITRGAIPVLSGPLLEMALHWDDAKRVMLDAPVAAPLTAPRPARNYNEGESVIGAFNERYSVREILERNGYVARGESRYLAPTSSTGMAGVHILRRPDGRECVYSHHGSDLLAGENTHDAFSAYALLEHNADTSAAVKAAAADLGMRRPEPAAAPSISVETIRANWAEKGEALVEHMIGALDLTQMHHHSRRASIDLLANIYMKAAEGKIEIVNGQPCVMVGGMNGLAAELGGRPSDASARLRLMTSHGFLQGFHHSDPSDKRSALMIVVPADPFDLTFLRLTREGLQSLNLRPETVDTRRPNSRKHSTPPVQRQSRATPTGGVECKTPKNPLQDAMRVALVLARHPGLSLKELARRARCRAQTLRKHLAVLTAAGLAEGTRLLVTFPRFFQLARAAVADRTAARLRTFMEAAEKFAAHSLRLARFGVAECQRTAPARRRLLLRSRELLNSFTPSEVAA